MRRRALAGIIAIGLALLVMSSAALASGPALKWQACTGGTNAFAQQFNTSNCATTTMGLTAPLGMVVSPDGKSVYATNFTDVGIVHFQRGPEGRLTYASCIKQTGDTQFNCAQTQPSACSQFLAMSSDGKSLYATGCSSIIVYARNTSNGNLTLEGCIGDRSHNTENCSTTAKGLSATYTISVSPDDRSVYVTAIGRDDIAVFHRNTTTGNLSYQECVASREPTHPLPCLESGKGFESDEPLAISPNGKDAYIGGRALAHFHRHADGTLHFVGCVRNRNDHGIHCAKKARGLRSGEGVAISANGKSLYAVGYSSNALVRFKRAANGALTPAGCVGDTGHNPSGCATTAKGLRHPLGEEVSPDDKSVYVLTQGFGSGGGLVAFKRSSGGSLSYQTCYAEASFNLENCPHEPRGLGFVEIMGQLALSPDGTSLYMTNANFGAPGSADGPALLTFSRTP